MAYGWSPQQIDTFGKTFRQLCPNGYLCLEHTTGHIPVGNGEADWAPGGIMQSYDVLLSEFDTGRWDDSVWQVLARMIGPAYTRPPDQPADDDPSPPYYLAPGTPRGPYGYAAFEYYMYEFVRGASSQVIQLARDRFHAMGVPHVC